MGGSLAGRAADAAPAHSPDAALWHYAPANGAALGVRASPGIDAEMVPGAVVEPGDLLWIAEEVPGADGVLYLRLADGRGWVFDRKPEVGAMCTRIHGARQSIDEALARARVRAVSSTGSAAAVDGRFHRGPGRSLEGDYTEHRWRVLGTGSNGSVRLGTCRRTGAKVAIKHLDLKKAGPKGRAALITEMEILLSLDHTHIVRLVGVYETEDRLSLVMEYLEGGELFNRIKERVRFSEQEAAESIRQILRAVQYSHSMGVAHRDLKLENFLYDSRGGNSLKLIDFGFGRFCDTPESNMTDSVGTVAYLAPEVISKNCSYNRRCDLWSTGVIAYVLLSGEMPFSADCQKQTLRDIRAANYSFSGEAWAGVSPEAQDFVRGLLQLRPEDRPSAEQALQHHWLLCNGGAGAAAFPATTASEDAAVEAEAKAGADVIVEVARTASPGVVLPVVAVAGKERARRKDGPPKLGLLVTRTRRACAGKGAGPTSPKSHGCYLLDRRWRILFMFPLLFSLTATSNLVLMQ